jgi:hypothetical protein
MGVFTRSEKLYQAVSHDGHDSNSIPNKIISTENKSIEPSAHIIAVYLLLEALILVTLLIIYEQQTKNKPIGSEFTSRCALRNATL